MTTDLKLNPQNSVIIADFDGTLIKARTKEGKDVPSIISILRDHNVLNAKYSEEAQALAGFYKPIEKDQNLSHEDRFAHMNDWWTKHFDVLINHRLTKENIRQAVNHDNIVLREGTRELINYVKENSIPFIIFSASGIGYDSIKLVLEREELDYENIIIISNSFNFNEAGIAKIFNLPVVHSLAKTGTFLMTTKAKDVIGDRKEAVVIGDSIHDVQMSEGANFEKVVSIGIVNDVTPENVEKYSNAFDVLVKDGESLESILDMFV